jgi:hypothetical protein
LNTGSSVYYVDLFRVTRKFIAGTVVFKDTDDCAEGVTATLEVNGKSVLTRTNNYGDFEFDGLNTGKYLVKLEYPGYVPKSIPVNLTANNYLGNIFLTKS